MEYSKQFQNIKSSNMCKYLMGKAIKKSISKFLGFIDRQLKMHVFMVAGIAGLTSPPKGG